MVSSDGGRALDISDVSCRVASEASQGRGAVRRTQLSHGPAKSNEMSVLMSLGQM